ncbi:MAG: aminotransferase class V-fold PLP-dependent enzyme [Oligoflexia bacterium]|nr:aminotransferase class V-fold PLP-dependent enzyme [Oligoflexia bacterium]
MNIKNVNTSVPREESLFLHPHGHFDNATTSYPKFPILSEMIDSYLENVGGNYGRTFYSRAYQVALAVEETRVLLAKKLGVHKPQNIMFCSGATEALNGVLRGFISSNKEMSTKYNAFNRIEKVWLSPLEHNAVTRTVHRLQVDFDIAVEILPADTDGRINLEECYYLPFTDKDLVIVNHQSNVNGVINPIGELKKVICRKGDDVPLVVDAAQSLSFDVPFIGVEKAGIDALVFSAHKGLMGPTGLGGFYLKNEQLISEWKEGGTASLLIADSMDMPSTSPEKFEAGTLNLVGIYGLKAVLDLEADNLIEGMVVSENDRTRRHQLEDFLLLLDEVKKIPDFTVYAANDSKYQGEIFSIRHRFMSNSELGRKLWEQYNIETRVGVHCALSAHRYLNTIPAGTVRFSPSFFHTANDFQLLVQILYQLGS